MNDLIAQAAAADFESRAVMAVRELGAYEAFWEGTSFKTLADTFREHPGSIPSDFVLLLRRSSTTESDYRTGDRLTPEALYSLLELDSAAVAVKPLREAIVLFDDVITTGK